MAKVDYNKLPYRPCVGIMLVNNKGQIFVARRIDSQKDDAWQMPQGGVEEGEDYETAAKRELLEEIGTNNIEIITFTNDFLYYDIPTSYIPKFWNGKYRGQKQIWFLAKFLGNDSDINLETEEPEFSAWQWVDFESLISNVVPFKRKIYEQVIAEFSIFIDSCLGEDKLSKK